MKQDDLTVDFQYARWWEKELGILFSSQMFLDTWNRIFCQKDVVSAKPKIKLTIHASLHHRQFHGDIICNQEIEKANCAQKFNLLRRLKLETKRLWDTSKRCWIIDDLCLISGFVISKIKRVGEASQKLSFCLRRYVASYFTSQRRGKVQFLVISLPLKRQKAWYPIIVCVSPSLIARARHISLYIINEPRCPLVM